MQQMRELETIRQLVLLRNQVTWLRREIGLYKLCGKIIVGAEPLVPSESEPLLVISVF
jgi:hypothetical protein